MENSSSQPARQFHRRILLRLVPLTILPALAAALLLPVGLAVWLAVVMIMLGIVIFVVPYKSDRVAFGADGAISVGVQTLRPENFLGCEYRRIVVSGRTFRLSGFALYGRMSSDGTPQLFIPAHGWLRADRMKLFQALSAWLGKVDGDIDEKVRQRLDELARPTARAARPRR
jgi:hypothetical protein